MATSWRTDMGGNAADPLFALRVVNPVGGETRLLSTDMRLTARAAAVTYAHPDCSVHVQLRWRAPRLEVSLRNAGRARLAVDFYGPLVTRLTERGCKAHIPQVGGVVFPVKDSNYLHHNSGQLASLFMILQAGEAGLALGHEKTAEDEGRYRSGIAVHGRGLPIGRYSGKISDKVGSAVENKMGDLLAGEPASELGGVACFAENLVLGPRESRALGPYLILPYTGAWTQGAALLREHRYPRRYRPRPRWFESVHNLSEICCGPEKRFDALASTWREQRAWGSPLFALCWFFKGNIEARLPVFEPGDVIGYLIRHGETLILTAANLMGWGFADGQRIKVTLPVPAATLYDRVRYRYYEVRDGKAEIRLKPHGVVALEILKT